MYVHRFNDSDARVQRGIAMPVLIAAVAILVLLAVAAWFLILRPDGAPGPAAVRAPVAATGQAAPVAPPPADVGNMTVEELLKEARGAMRAQRLLAPSGNNAFEFYLKVLEKDPGNRVAQDALRETFPFAANAAEQEINAGNFAEAQRQIDVLTKADSGNYTLTILRSKLDAGRELAARAEEQEKLAAEQAAAREAEAALAAEQAQTNAAAAQTAPPPESALAVEQPVQQPQPQLQPEPEPPPPPQPVGETRGVRLVQTVQPDYPPVAARRRQQGWVDVEFQVDATGKVINARVADTQRGDTFNRAAIAAVEQWTFEPALRNGQPVTSPMMSQRIVFSLSGAR